MLRYASTMQVSPPFAPSLSTCASCPTMAVTASQVTGRHALCTALTFLSCHRIVQSSGLRVLQDWVWCLVMPFTYCHPHPHAGLPTVIMTMCTLTPSGHRPMAPHRPCRKRCVPVFDLHTTTSATLLTHNIVCQYLDIVKDTVLLSCWPHLTRLEC